MPIKNKNQISSSFKKQVKDLLYSDSKKLITKFEDIHNKTFESLELVDSGWLRNQSYVDYDKSEMIFGFRTPPNFNDHRNRSSANYAIAAYFGLNWNKSIYDFSSHARYGQRRFNEFAAISSLGFLTNGSIKLTTRRGAPEKRFNSPIFNYK